MIVENSAVRTATVTILNVSSLCLRGKNKPTKTPVTIPTMAYAAETSYGRPIISDEHAPITAPARGPN